MAIEISVSTMEGVLVWAPTGRFDASGADGFDRKVSGLDAATRWMILDLKQVTYLSSAGIRSLVKLGKLLHQRKGWVVISGASEFVGQTISMAGLPSFLHSVPSVPEAARLIATEERAALQTSEVEINGRSYTVLRLPPGPCTMEMWGEDEPFAGESVDADKLISASLEELGLAFGLGGLGNDRSQAAEAVGLFIATGHLAWVLPADGRCLPDFIRSESPADTQLHLAAATGISGRPSFYIQGESLTVSLENLVGDLFQLVTSVLKAPAPVLGLLLSAESVSLAGTFFRHAVDIIRNTPETLMPVAGEGLTGAGMLLAGPEILGHGQGGVPVSLLQAAFSIGDGILLIGQAIRHGTHLLDMGGHDEQEYLKSLNAVEDPLGVLRLGPETKVRRLRAWVYVPSEVRAGTEKQLRIELAKGGELPVEWDAITRRIYTDSARVVLTPLTGGYAASTFQVTSYDRDGRKLLPTVLKISSLAFTEREEQAYHRYVEKFILNNSTVIMGRATRGRYAGLRYNFLGITGAEGGLSWMADHYVRRPVEELILLFDTLFSSILKPWYGQPRAEVIRPYAEHNPLGLFPAILEDAERDLGIAPATETMPCPELGLELPNPYRFLKTEYAKRQDLGCSWYTSVIHGDLNLNNILLDERENLYVIDFSETRIGDVVSDFSRLEAHLKLLMTRLENASDLARLLEFELALAEAKSMADMPRFQYWGDDPMVEKCYRILCLLRRYADRVTLFEEDLRPYLLGVLQWTYPVVSFRQLTPLRRRLSAASAGIIVRQILQLEKGDL